MTSLQPTPNDIFVDGFLAHMFSPQDAHIFFALLLKVPNFLQHYRISYSQGGWYMMPYAPFFQQPSPGFPIQNVPFLLDFSIRMTEGTVVPQRRWTPADDVDFRRHVQGARLQLPVFFVNRRGGIGFGLPEILDGRDRDLLNGDGDAPLGGKTTAFIRINWPGYDDWKRQIPCRDETQARKPITLARFMKHVGNSVDRFMNQCMVCGRHVGDPKWAIGMNGVVKGQVKIIGAVHVSAGTWQPMIQLTRYVI